MSTDLQEAPPATESRALVLREALIILASEERYAGLVLAEDGSPSHHLVLLPQLPPGHQSWKAAMDWAKALGGDLPTRQEAALLYANAKSVLDVGNGWHWTNEPTGSSSAWVQHFHLGSQHSFRQYHEFWARAVRRLPL